MRDEVRRGQLSIRKTGENKFEVTLGKRDNIYENHFEVVRTHKTIDIVTASAPCYLSQEGLSVDVGNVETVRLRIEVLKEGEN